MQLKALQIAQLIKGTVDGDPNVLISAPSKIDETYPQTITFFANPKNR